MNIAFSSTPVRVLAVVVLYKMAPKESPTLRTLFEASRMGIELGIIIHDNSPDQQDANNIPSEARYFYDPKNSGLSSAYNRAIEIANAEGYPWLLTLDQDTVLPPNFLTRLAELAKELEASPEIGAIVPQVFGEGKPISPFTFLFNAIPRFRHSASGIFTTATYALNSAAMLRLTALREVGGYDPMFPLDISDISLFHRLHLSGKKVYFAADLLISHDFSMLRKQNRMSLERYRSLLLDECAFWDTQMGFLARGERMVRLAGRICKEMWRSEEHAFRNVTFGELKRRLATPRAQRLVEWKKWATARLGDSQAPGPLPEINK